MATFLIRDYQPSDRPALLALVRELQAAEARYHDRMKPPDQIGDWYVDGLQDDCREGGGTILVALEGSHLVAYAVLVFKNTADSDPDEVAYRYAYVQDLAVAETHRRRGLGSLLLERCEAMARHAGLSWLRISVLAANEPALRAYESYGFKPLFVDLEKPLL